MPMIFLLAIVLGLFVALGSTYVVMYEKDVDNFDRAASAGSVILVILLLINTSNFFKDYSQCFPTH